MCELAETAQAMAVAVVVEDSEVRYPRISSQVAKSLRAVDADSGADSGPAQHRGLMIQLESDKERRVWHVVYRQARAAAGGCADSTAEAGDKTDAEPSTEKVPNFHKSLCLREMDAHKCAIMSSIFSPKKVPPGSSETLKPDSETQKPDS